MEKAMAFHEHNKSYSSSNPLEYNRSRMMQRPDNPEPKIQIIQTTTSL